MDNKIATYEANSLYHCARLLSELENNKYDAERFFGGDMHNAYLKATDKAINKARNIRAKIRNL